MREIKLESTVILKFGKNIPEWMVSKVILETEQYLNQIKLDVLKQDTKTKILTIYPRFHFKGEK